MKIGQKLICVEAFEGVYTDSEEPAGALCPKLWEVVTYDGSEMFTGGYYLAEYNLKSLRGFRACYVERKFRRLDDVLAEISIEDLMSQVTEALDRELVHADKITTP